MAAAPHYYVHLNWAGQGFAFPETVDFDGPRNAMIDSVKAYNQVVTAAGAKASAEISLKGIS
jgi:hypothetical protein